MLLELKVTHFAVIDSLQVYFLRPGLNVLTGETGAGKSILIKSLSLLLGAKATPDMVRTGHDQAVIEGAFDLSERPDLQKELKELSLDSGDQSLVVRRIVSQTGKHRLYINGHLSTLNVLEKIVPRLIEITGQHEHHSLIKASSQLTVLDNFAEVQELRKKFSGLFSQVRSIRDEIETAVSTNRDREQKLDFLKFQIKEIEAFNPQLGEDVELVSQHQRARFASKLHSFAQKSEGILYSQEMSVSSQVGDLVREGQALSDLDPKLKSLTDTLKEASVLIEDAAFGFRDYAKNDIDENELERLEDRVSGLKKIQKKYGASVEEILSFKEKALGEIETLEKNDEQIRILEENLKKTEAEMSDIALILHTKRVTASKKLALGINAEIQALNMKGTEFSIVVNKLSELTSTGLDEVSFLIKSSPKDEPRPISRVASGGELSRLMLAIKQVVAAGDKPMTYLFDEVDTGVSGPTAEKVGRKLKSIGFCHQVVCITHLPQVASLSDAHFLITKEISGGLVKSEIKELALKERIQELARMLSGEKVTAASLTHARELIKHTSSLAPKGGRLTKPGPIGGAN